MNNNKEKNKQNISKLSNMQKVELAVGRIFNLRKWITSLILIIPMMILNYTFSIMKPFIDINNFYRNALIRFNLHNIPIIKDLTANIILSIILYIAFVIAIFKRNSLDKKAEQCKELNITDNGESNGNTIIPIKEYYDRKTKTTTLKCFSNGVIKEDFEKNNNLERLSSKWNRYILDVSKYKRDKLIITYKSDYSKRVEEWKNTLLNPDDFKIVLGIDDANKIREFDFNNTPSMIIASASGGGKTTLFKNIMLQSYLKGAEIIICDFKMGLDFNKGWSDLNRCKVITDFDGLWGYLKYDIHDICVDRASLLNKYKCSDIREFNLKVDNHEVDEPKLKRIMIGIDEASEISIKSKNKEKEKLLEDIREEIDKIAHLYRAIGIHLIISTQVPSSQVLSEQVRHNAFIRVCGRANKILSQVAIENENASTISKDERGRFATGGTDNYFFQGYIFNDEKVLNKIIEGENK